MKGSITLSFAVLSGAALAQSSDLVIDDFKTGSFDTGYFSAGSVSQWVNASSAIGGQRMVGLNIQDNPLENSAKARVRTTGQSDFSVILEPGVNATSFLQYGNGNGFNFSGYKDISLAFNTSDRDLEVQLVLMGTNNATLRSWTQTYNNVDQSGVLKFGLGDSLSLGDVKRISVNFTPRTGGDFSLNKISASPVPEPATFAVIGVGAVALLRRRKKA